MLSENDLKDWLHRDLPAKDKLLLVLGTFGGPVGLSEVRDRSAKAGFKIPPKWNPSSILGRTKGLAINVPGGWELSNSGKQYLRNLGVGGVSPAAIQVATDLRLHLSKITDLETRTFVEEAVKCHEAELYRSAVVMSWLAAIAVLHREVLKNHLSSFNAEASSKDPKWKPAKTADDLGRMKEYDFLERICAISVIGKNPKEELQKALKLRNACGHPSSLKIGPNMVASHIETLLLNVFDVFQA